MPTELTAISHDFDMTRLRHLLGVAGARFNVDHRVSCTSTSSVLLQQAEEGAPSGTVIITDRQTAGRGRRGRTWHSAAGDSLTFSVLWRFPESVALAGLSLAVGLAVVRGLERLGVEALGLKWPNDIWLYARKLGGVLIEAIRAERGMAVVIGIGLNMRRNAHWSSALDQPYAALEEAGFDEGREALLATLLGELLSVLDRFALEGFATLRCEWESRNALHALPVRVLMEGREIVGTCGGVDERGALEVHTDDGHIVVWGGDVSLRLR